MAPLHGRLLQSIVIVSLTLLAAGCVQQGLWTDQIKQLLSTTCPVPQQLSDADKKKLLEFSGKVSNIVKQVAGDQLAAQVRQAALSAYGATDQVNRTYALGHAACAACRLDALNVLTCAQTFVDVIRSLTTTERGVEEPPDVHAAKQYSNQLLRGMLPPD